MRGSGTDEPWFFEEMSGMLGMMAVAAHYRKPLRVDEVARMAPTPEVKERKGRP